MATPISPADDRGLTDRNALAGERGETGETGGPGDTGGDRSGAAGNARSGGGPAGVINPAGTNVSWPRRGRDVDSGGGAGGGGVPGPVMVAVLQPDTKETTFREEAEPAVPLELTLLLGTAAAAAASPLWW